MISFGTEKEFCGWLKLQPEENYSYSFLPNSNYPLHLELERMKNRVIIKEICRGGIEAGVSTDALK